MFEYSLVCLFVLACAVVQSASHRRSVRALCIAVSFLVLFLFMGLRYSYGNDYWGYVAIFNEAPWLRSSPTNQIEVGWLWLNVLMRPLGFRALIIGTAIFYLVVLFLFICREVPRRYIWVSFFLLLLEPSSFLVHLSAMRQSVAIVIFVIAVRALASRKIVLYLLLVGIASTFHRSALAMLPLFVVALPELSGRISSLMSGRRWIIFYLTIYLGVVWVLMRFGSSWLESLQSEVSRYRSYAEKGTLGLGLGVLVQVGFLSLFIYYGLQHHGRERIILYVCAATYLIIPLVFVSAMAGRLMMYPQITMLVALPLILRHEKRKIIRSGILLLFSAWTLLASMAFWTSEIYAPHFMKYESVLSI